MGSSILLTGSKGRLARWILRRRPEIRGYDLELDIRDTEGWRRALEREKPGVLINCAALTDVEYCEAHAEECWEVNCRAVERLAALCSVLGVHLVHFSSDYALNPVNEYGRAKEASEKAVRPTGLVLRTDLYDQETFLIKKLLSTEEPVSAYSDKFFNPISMPSFAQALFEMLGTKGLYNVATIERVSMEEFARRACRVFGRDERRVVPAASQEAPGRAPRPKEMYLKPHVSLRLDDDLRRFKDELER